MKNVLFSGLIILFTSCAVTNNFYVNDILEEQESEGAFGYLGVSTGLQPDANLDADGSTIIFNDSLTLAFPNIIIGGQIGSGKHLDFRAALHLVGLVGGGGLRGGMQYAVMDRTSNTNIAFGADIGFSRALTIDSDKNDGVDGEEIGYNPVSTTLDLYSPLVFKVAEDKKLIITARYTLGTYQIRFDTIGQQTYRHKERIPSISIGFRSKWGYFEGSVMKVGDQYIPNFGLAKQLN